MDLDREPTEVRATSEIGRVSFGVCNFIGIPWHYLLRDT